MSSTPLTSILVAKMTQRARLVARSQSEQARVQVNKFVLCCHKIKVVYHEYSHIYLLLTLSI